MQLLNYCGLKLILYVKWPDVKWPGATGKKQDNSNITKTITDWLIFNDFKNNGGT